MTRPHIVRDKAIHGGRPIILGTRWPTDTVVDFDFDVLAIVRAYPHLTYVQAHAACDYERRLHRRLGRQAWRLRERVGYWLIGEERE